MNIMIKKQAMP